MAEPQNLKNHARHVPGYHFLLAGLLAVILVHALLGLREYSPRALNDLLIAVALVLVAWYGRAFALGAQDRVIRIEMRLRVNELAPQYASRFDELAIGQVIALRFAGDDELAALLQRVLEGELVKPADIKAAVKHWKADTLRV